MRKWILFALLALVLVWALTMREGVDDTLTPSPCNSGEISKGMSCVKYTGDALQCPSSFTEDGGSCSKSNSDGTKTWTTKKCPAGQDMDSDNKCFTSRPGHCPDGYDFKFDNVVEPGKCEKALTAAQIASANYASRSGYADILRDVQDTNRGPLPNAIDERTGTLDVGASRPMTGPVFDESGQLGTGQGTGAAAAASISGGNTYNTTPTKEGTLDPYDLWPGTKQKPRSPPAGQRLPVDGPSWGGLGAPAVSSSSSSSKSVPALYGPVGTNPVKNSQDTSNLPSNASAGSDPENQYAVTSRAPGDQDLFPNPYIQSTIFSLANGSQKTDPVPFLTDFSAFQK